ncbi:MAG TPA: hypothetical protein VJ810_21225 [Blastocatellia bacterium]|nr:hypothetical protein [Blastocatellia bacterium]
MGKPTQVKDTTYKDDEYEDVILVKIATSIYKITNEGEYKDKVVCYMIEDGAYYETSYNKEKDRYSSNDIEFDIGQVSSLQSVKAKAPTSYNNIGENGKGVGFVETETTLRTTGLNTCVGWLLYNDNAAYLAHIVVDYPARVIADGSIATQVQELYNKFSDIVDSPPTHVRIQVDEGQPAYNEKTQVWMSGWMKELVPASCKVEWIRGEGVLSYVVPARQGDKKEWDGAPIKLKYSEKL